MRIAPSLGFLILTLGLCGTAGATDLDGRLWPWSWYPSLKPCPGCPDDYCAKPMPCTSPVKCCGPDDYCAKPMPCTSPVKCCGPDDYCPKPMPIVPRCCYPPWYNCGPAPGCSQPDGGQQKDPRGPGR
jgi:hypothetical protein